MERSMAERTQRAAPTAESHNLLVVSDLHIGQDCNGHGRMRALRSIVRLDRELRAFLRYYATHRVNDRPWRLVLAGDVIDFMQVSLRPKDGEARTRWHFFRLTPEEAQYGLGHGAERSVWKLERVMDRHRRVFLALAEFVAAGHELCVIRGNHDNDLHWEEVQRAFVALLGEIHARAHRGDRADLEQRIHFYPWFYYQEGLLYIEHGHQYDEFSSFEYFLDPVPPPEAKREDMPIPMLALRYFANQIPNFPSLEQDSWRASDYLRWVVRCGISPLRILYMYLRLILKIFFVHGRGRGAPRDAGWLERRLGDLERVYGMPRALLRRITQLHVKPVGHHLWRSIQVLCVDRIFVVLALFGTLAALAVAPLPGWAEAALMVGASGLSVAALWWLGKLRDVTCGRQLARAARSLAEHLRVKFVVMGHTHEPMAHVVSEAKSWYLNTGTWIPPPPRLSHAGACDCHLTHLAVVAEGPEARARLLRWCSAARRPEQIEEVG
jgi:UDP-2,3-diacylglucosamine pyrophosphatase LpxH